MSLPYNRRNYVDFLLCSPNLSYKEEQKLLKDRFAQENYNALITSHAKLVVKEANIYQNYTTISMDDLVQEGMLGLMRAIEKFEIQNGSRFSTYARWWIRAFIQEYILMFLYTIKNQKKRLELLSDYSETKKAIQLNTDPSDLYGLDCGFVHNVSLDDEKIYERFADPSSNIEAKGLDNMLFQLRSQWLEVAITELSLAEIYVIKQLYLEKRPTTIKEISEKIGLSPSRTKILVTKALRKLKCILMKRTKKLQRYF